MACPMKSAHRSLLFLACCAAALLVPGCSCQEEVSAASLRAQAIAACEQAQTAHAAQDPAAAEAAARGAEAAVQALRRIQEAAANSDTPSPDAESLAADLDAACRAGRDARRHADLAREEKLLLAAQTGLKARAYTAARDAAYGLALKGLALAAEQAGQAAGPAPDTATQEALDASAHVARVLVPEASLADGTMDWATVTATLRRASGQPVPASLHAALAFGWLCLGRTGWALCEVKDCTDDPSAPLKTRQALFALRGFVYRFNELDALATQQFEDLAGLDGSANAAAEGQQIEGLVHLALAFHYLDGKRYREADVALMRATQVWPNNPIAVLLTGEIQSANGEYEEAQATLDRVHGSVDDVWLAQVIRARARQIRDSHKPPEPLFHDPKVMSAITLCALGEAARESAVAQRVVEKLHAARALASRLLGEMPGANAPREQAADSP